MNSVLIAVFLVMVIMTTFTFIILRMVVASTGDKIRDNVITQLKSYDALIQKKEAELQDIKIQLENESNQVKNNQQIGIQYDDSTAGVIVTSNAKYLNNSFAVDYKNIKEKFSFDHKPIVQTIYKESQDKNDTNIGKLIDGLLEKFSLENTYKLSAFDSEEQMEIINDIVTSDEKEIMQEFILYNGGFHCLTFYQWLYLQKKMKDNKILVRTSSLEDNFDEISDLIKAQYDDKLCEGIQIFMGNKMYDYGIREYELI